MNEKKVKEAIEILKGIEEVRGNLPEDGNEIEEAFIVAIEALEKQLPKKPIMTEDKQFALCYCCNGKGLLDKQVYCDNCGQKIDWSE